MIRKISSDRFAATDEAGFGAGDSGTQSDPFQLNIVALALASDTPGVNDAPTSTSLDGDAATYIIGATTDVRIDVGANVTISDLDSADFAGGTLRIQIEDPIYLEDALVRFIGTNRTLFNPGHVTSIGTVTVGEDADVVIALSTAATPATVQEFLRNLYYFNANTFDPSEEPRRITITLKDGDGTADGGSDTLVIHTTVTALRVNNAPYGGDAFLTIDPDVAYTFRIEDFPFEDMDGDQLAGIVITTLANGGEILFDGAAVSAGQFVAAGDIEAGLLTFAATGGEYGPTWADFTFQVRDDGGTANGGEDTNPYPSTFAFEIVDAPTASIQPNGFAPLGETRVGPLDGSQSELAIAALSFANSYVVSWTQTHAPGEPSEVYAQVFQEDGTPAGNAYLVSTHAAHSTVAADNGAGFIVAWESDGRVFVEQFGWNGTPSAYAVQVTTVTPGTETHLSVTALAYGGFVVAWHDNVAEGMSTVFTQRFDQWGMPAGFPRQVDGVAADPSIVGLNDGSYVVTWTAHFQDGSGSGVFAQRYSEWGDLLGTYQVNSTSQGDQQHPAIVASPDGGFVIVWQSNHESVTGDFGLYAQRYDASGSPSGGEFRIDSFTAPAEGTPPAVTALPDGGFVVAWQSADGSDIFSRRFDSANNPLAAETQANSHAAGDQLDPAVAVLEYGELIVGWQSLNPGWAGGFVQHYREGFEATEHVSLDLKGRMAVDATEFGEGPIEVILSVFDGILDVEAGGSAVEISGSGTYEVHLIGTAAQINALLRTDPDSLVTFTAGDATLTRNGLVLTVLNQGELVGEAFANIGVIAINDAPTLWEPYSPYVEFNAAWGPAGLMQGVYLNDPDGDHLAGGTIRLSIDGDAASGAGIFLHDSPWFSVADNGDGTFSLNYWDYWSSGRIGTIEGLGTLDVRITDLNPEADFNRLNDLIDEFVYFDPSPTASERTVTLTVMDGANGGRGGEMTASVSQTLFTSALPNEAPVVTTSPGETAFVEGSGAPSEAVAVDAALTLSDADDATLVSAAVAIAEGYQSGEDALSFTNDDSALYGDISASFADGVLSLSSSGGAATLDQWQAALRAVRFTTSAEAPVAGSRTVTFTVNDGEADSALASKLMSVGPLNDAPSGSDATLVVAEDGTYVFAKADFGFTDVDGNGFLAVAFAGPPTGGTLCRLENDAWTPVDWTGPESLTVSVADIAAGRLSFRPDADLNGTAAASIAFQVVDDGPSTGGHQSIDPTPNQLLFDVTAIDDAATARHDAFATDEAGIVTGNLFADNGSGTDRDVDGPALRIFSVNGSAANVGGQVMLASGALLTVNADGTFIYDPNGAFDSLATPATGGANTTAADSFTYALAGGDTATVTLIVSGIDGNDDIIGTAGSDVLVGDGGQDRFFGQTGDDLYFVNDPADLVFEQAGQGTDRVLASSDYALAAGSHVERLSTSDPSGTSPIRLTGNALGQQIDGNAGNNFIDGKGGADVLFGGGGADQFAFTTSPGGGNVDRILDFSTVHDRILLENAVFTGLGPGTLSSAAFRTGASARDSSDRIIYNPMTGALYFDADGSHGAAAVLFATLQPGLNLNAGDFLVI